MPNLWENDLWVFNNIIVLPTKPTLVYHPWFFYFNGIVFVHALEPNVKLQQSNSNEGSMGNIAYLGKI
jgi:hypothetical protein